MRRLYVDYYYVIYAVALTGLLLLHGALTLERVSAGWASVGGWRGDSESSRSFSSVTD